MRDEERESTTGRVTNQDLDRRLGRVEGIQEQHGVRLHELGNEVGVVKLQVEHAQEMIRVRFTGLESAMAAASTKLDALLERNAAIQADPSATPAGRLLQADIDELRRWQSRQEPTLDGARGVMTAWRVVAGGSLLTATAALVALAIALGIIK